MTGSDATALEGAEIVTRLGGFVFPVLPWPLGDTPGKTPAVSGWQKEGLATRLKPKIKEWRREFYDCNFGVFTGKWIEDGKEIALLVADVDVKNGKSGEESVRTLEAEGCPFPATFTVLTPSGGRHLYYTVPQPVKGGANVLGRGIDVRSDVGFVVAPGGTINGSAYKITNCRKPEPAPPWMVDRCGAPRTRSDAAAAPVPGVDPDAANARAIHYLQHEAPVAIEGQGGDETTYKVAAGVKDRGIADADACAALMLDYWNGRAVPPWDPDKLREKCRNAYRYGLNPPGVAAPETVFEVVPAEDPKPAPDAGITTDTGGYITPKLAPFDPNASRIGDVFTTAPAQPRFVVQGLYPVACGQENSIGGLGKTTRRLWEAVHLILGRPLYGYPVVQAGPVLMVTKEDGADIFRYRLHRVATAMDLSPVEQKRIAKNLHVLDLTGDVAARLAAVDRAGNLYATELAERIYRGYKAEGIVQVCFDPWNGFSPGEKHVNDAEAALMQTGALISRELACNTCYIGHVSKAVAREKIIDAHAGRGGSAMGDNARFVLSYVPHDPKDDGKAWPAPADAEGAAMQGNLFRLHVTKQSYAKRRIEPIWIERQGYGFRVHEGAPESPAARLAADGARLQAFLQDELGRGIKHTQRTLDEQHERFGMSRRKAREVAAWLQAAGGLVERSLPESERQGRRTHFLEPVVTPAPELTDGDPFQ